MTDSSILECKDHTVSGEMFKLRYDPEYDMLITTPQPTQGSLPEYYKSENYISHTDAKKSLFDRLYQIIKNHTISKKVSYIKATNPGGKSLLDIGAGTGDFLVAAKKKGWEVEGVEPNSNARKLAENKGIILRETTKDLKGTYDVITLWHVLEHLPDLENQIAHLHQILNPGGTIFVAVPNYKSYDANHYKQYWAAYDVPRHLWHFSKKSIELKFKREKLFVVKLLPMIFDAFYVSLLSEKYKTGKMNPIKAFWVGLTSNWKAKITGEYSSLIYIIKSTKKQI